MCVRKQYQDYGTFGYMRYVRKSHSRKFASCFRYFFKQLPTTIKADLLFCIEWKTIYIINAVAKFIFQDDKRFFDRIRESLKILYQRDSEQYMLLHKRISKYGRQINPTYPDDWTVSSYQLAHFAIKEFKNRLKYDRHY